MPSSGRSGWRSFFNRFPGDVVNMSLLDVRHLRKSFGGQLAVVDVSLSLERGEVLGLLGPNGAGKSTTMLMMAGLLSPDAGKIEIEGKSYDGRDRETRRLLGVVPQELAIYPDLNAYENLSFFGRLYGLRGGELSRRCDQVLDRIGLTDSARRPAGNYSGGMKRRLNFGVALMHRPAVLILDEPTVGVDPQSRSHLLECIREQARSGVGIIYASHYMEEVQSICDRVAIVDHGRVLACDTVPRLLAGIAADLLIYVEDGENVRQRLRGLLTVEDASDGRPVIAIKGNAADMGERLREVLYHLAAVHMKVESVETSQSNLESLFLQLTGYGLRD
jgi:ABC-2 type transport system ATP-binding protein